MRTIFFEVFVFEIILSNLQALLCIAFFGKGLNVDNAEASTLARQRPRRRSMLRRSASAGAPAGDPRTSFNVPQAVRLPRLRAAALFRRPPQFARRGRMTIIVPLCNEYSGLNG